MNSGHASLWENPPHLWHSGGALRKPTTDYTISSCGCYRRPSPPFAHSLTHSLCLGTRDAKNKSFFCILIFICDAPTTTAPHHTTLNRFRLVGYRVQYGPYYPYLGDLSRLVSGIKGPWPSNSIFWVHICASICQLRAWAR